MYKILAKVVWPLRFNGLVVPEMTGSRELKKYRTAVNIGLHVIFSWTYLSDHSFLLYVKLIITAQIALVNFS